MSIDISSAQAVEVGYDEFCELPEQQAVTDTFEPR